jgi:hypothetical protein
MRSSIICQYWRFVIITFFFSKKNRRRFNDYIQIGKLIILIECSVFIFILFTVMVLRTFILMIPIELTVNAVVPKVVKVRSPMHYATVQ